MNSIAREKFFSGSGTHRIWMRAILVFEPFGIAEKLDSWCCSRRPLGGAARACFVNQRRASQSEATTTIHYFTEFAGTIFTLSITTRFVGLLISPELFLVTGVPPIFSSTSSPLINLPKVVYCPLSLGTGARQMKNCEPAESGSGPRAIEITPRSCE